MWRAPPLRLSISGCVGSKKSLLRWCAMADSTSLVLILETDTELSNALAELFEVVGFEVREEADSYRGVVRIMERDPEVILIAEEIPPLGGVEVLPLLRPSTGAPMIVIGEGGDTAVVNALLQGADMYMSRPLNQRELLTRVRCASAEISSGVERPVSHVLVKLGNILCVRVRQRARARTSDSHGWTMSTSTRAIPQPTRLMKKGCGEGRSPFAGSLRVSLRYKLFPPSCQEEGRGMVEGGFQHPARRQRGQPNRSGGTKCRYECRWNGTRHRFSQDPHIC